MLHDISIFQLLGGLLALLLILYIFVRALSYAYHKSKSDIVHQELTKILNSINKGKTNGK